MSASVSNYTLKQRAIYMRKNGFSLRSIVNRLGIEEQIIKSWCDFEFGERNNEASVPARGEAHNGASKSEVVYHPSSRPGSALGAEINHENDNEWKDSDTNSDDTENESDQDDFDFYDDDYNYNIDEDDYDNEEKLNPYIGGDIATKSAPNSKPSNNTQAEIIRLILDEGMLQEEVRKRYQVSNSTIHRWLSVERNRRAREGCPAISGQARRHLREYQEVKKKAATYSERSRDEALDMAINESISSSEIANRLQIPGKVILLWLTQEALKEYRSKRGCLHSIAAKYRISASRITTLDRHERFIVDQNVKAPKTARSNGEAHPPIKTAALAENKKEAQLVSDPIYPSNPLIETARLLNVPVPKANLDELIAENAKLKTQCRILLETIEQLIAYQSLPQYKAKQLGRA